MTRRMHDHIEPKKLRAAFWHVIELAERAHTAEKDLIFNLYEFDRQQLYKGFGYKSLRGYLINCLKFSRIQAQRIATQVRRVEPTFASGVVDILKTSSPK